MEKFDVFISYASETREKAEKIKSVLCKKSVTAFLDTDTKIGEDFVDRINQAMVDAKCHLLMLDSFFIKKAWPKHEMKVAFNRYLATMSTRTLPLFLDKEGKDFWVKEFILGSTIQGRTWPDNDDLDSLTDEVRAVLKSLNT